MQRVPKVKLDHEDCKAYKVFKVRQGRVVFKDFRDYKVMLEPPARQAHQVLLELKVRRAFKAFKEFREQSEQQDPPE